jgi:hypothetical protein
MRLRLEFLRLEPGVFELRVEPARERFAEHTDETNLERLRTLLVDGRHSLNEMKQFMVTAVVR